MQLIDAVKAAQGSAPGVSVIPKSTKQRGKPTCPMASAHLAVSLCFSMASATMGGAPTFTVTELGTLGGAQSAAYGLNEANQVVGWSTIETGQNHAFLWEGGAMTDLGTLGGTHSRAWAINNDGIIVGESHPTGQNGDINYRAFIYQNQ